ncbi:MAG: hypothetical protein A2792_19530 [Sphingomonadales bacterium RIFCSPHIGHO2_01_FULL_65_20]|jgi:hypothetical protein|uniref:Uncharacterized protein n=1 Tax=Sphingomonas ursincola TaxID=56361 RepID=A0A7V8U8S8_9SPHN|nr:hypothetical protein [Sphingomonas ursincola]MBA4780129.1 hypothetical protein [Blastomonas sp.]OHC96573.1 MAG: hypothetical protein A2792_19530 [Sphingomonadales bacterium RIFCSPHIGHO2_01_FULL_65_20]MBA1374363.1 hypothetical protein [Sphingomonas ursincola]MBY0618903.1 hypothetical protein [Sphingomonas ursincola]MCH2239116.1 hypothetical protein [Blastomonas sp.]
MASHPPRVRPSDLPTKVVTAPDGSKVRMKVVQAESPSLPYDLLAAFRSNVRRIKADQKAQAASREDSPEA